MWDEMRRACKGQGNYELKEGGLGPVNVRRGWCTPVYTTFSLRVPAVKVVIWRGWFTRRYTTSSPFWAHAPWLPVHVGDNPPGGVDLWFLAPRAVSWIPGPQGRTLHQSC